MARPKGDAAANAARRLEILDAAVEVFATGGYRGSSLGQIAEKVGMTEAGILHHFKTKGNLLTAVLARRDDLTMNYFGNDDVTGIGFVRGWLRVISHNISVPGLVELFTVVSAEATTSDHPAHQFFKQRYVDTIENAKSAMERLQKSGYINPDAKTEDLARALVALSDGLQVQWLLDRNWDMLEEQKAYFRRILNDDGEELAGLKLSA